MSAATKSALLAQLVEQPPAPSVKRGLYEFLPTQEDPCPLTFPRTPVQEIGLDYFKPKTSASTVRRSISSKEVKELWSQARMRLGVSSLQDWGLAALQRAVESIQALPTDGSAVVQLTEQLASVRPRTDCLHG